MKRERTRTVRLPMLPLAAPQPAECMPQPCIRACRYSVLWDITPNGSIAIVGGPVIAPIRNNRRLTTDDDLEDAAARLVRLGRRMKTTCVWDYVKPSGMTQQQVARLLGVTRQRIEQIERDAYPTLESALLSLAPDDEWKPETRNEVTWPEPAPRLRRARTETDLNMNASPVTDMARARKAA